MSRPRAFLNFPRSFAERDVKLYDAVIDYVHDGDTYLIWVEVKELNTYVFAAARVAGYRSPEAWEPGGDEATEIAERVLPRDTPIKVKRVGMSFNRIVFEIKLQDGRTIPEAMADENAPVGGLAARELNQSKIAHGWSVKTDDKHEIPPRRRV